MNLEYNPKSNFQRKIYNLLSGWTPPKYWRRRSVVVDNSHRNTLRKLYYLLYIKYIDARMHCSFGTALGGAKYATPPLLFHGPYGIIIGHTVILGENVHIAQQVTIMQGEETTIIEDRVLCGAGCKILPGVHIGHDAKIGANAVVTKDVPACATVVLPPMRVIEQQV